MTKTRLVTELAVAIGSNPSALTKVLRAVSRRGVKILAYSRYSECGSYTIRLVTEAVLSAISALEEAGFTCTADFVVLVSSEYRTGTVAGTVAALRNHLSGAGIGVQYAYASNEPEIFAILKTADDERALRVIATTSRLRRPDDSAWAAPRERCDS